MKKFLLLLLFPLSFFCGEIVVNNPYQAYFNEAYKMYPSIPKGMLEAVSYTQTRFAHLDGSQSQSCVGMPIAYTPMGLIENGKNYFRNNLMLVANSSHYSVKSIKSSARISIIAYAQTFSE